MNKISFYLDGNIEIVIGAGLHKFPLHTHNSFMVGAVLEGCGEFYIDNKTSKLSKGDAYIVPSNTGIAINPISDFSYITICLKNELAIIMKDYRRKVIIIPIWVIAFLNWEMLSVHTILMNNALLCI